MKRPLEASERAFASRASWTGGRKGAQSTSVPRRSRSVRAAAWARKTIGSGPAPRLTPSRSTRMWSITQAES